MAACFKEGEPRWERGRLCSLGLSRRRLGCRGRGVSMDSGYPQALKRRSLPTALRYPLRTSDLVT